MNLTFFVMLSFALFAIGLIGVLTKRNVLIFFLSIELILNSANLLFIAFAQAWGNMTGQVWVFFVLVLAAVEAAVGFAIVINIYRTKQVIDIDQINSLKG
ncbi:MAG: NADH-quinone oxidoreductase subunit NuoK [Chlamydiia bacterium]|nr:NADH-quinone oxidoreductase subunit NuoK [Chlamydiia bacterium]